MRRDRYFAASMTVLFGGYVVLASGRAASAQAILEPPPVVASPTYIAVPPPQQEVITEAPAPSYVWVPGQWERTADDWSWNQGEWVQPPFSNAYWVPGYWQHHGGQFTWETAHWAAAQQGVVVQKPVTVPTLYDEVQPARRPPQGTSGNRGCTGSGAARGSGCRASTCHQRRLTPFGCRAAGK